MVGFNIITVACSLVSNIGICKLQWHFTYTVIFFLIGGLAGAASRITGAMAKGVAAITMDEDYQQKRREAMNKQPTGLREGITRGGKGLVSVRIKNDKNFIEVKIANVKVSVELFHFNLILVCQYMATTE